MKNLLLILTLLFTSVFFSSSSFAEWTSVSQGTGESNSGDAFYIDYDRIRKNDGFVYFWTLSDYLNPNQGYMSDKKYNQGDCKLFRVKSLSLFLHRKQMGGGSGEIISIPEDYKVWIYPPPKSIFEIILKSICSR